MDVAELKAEIASRNFRPFYIMTGPEWKVQQIYIEQIARASGKTLRFIESISDIASRQGAALMRKSYVYVLRDDRELMTNERAQENLERIVGDNIVILEATTLDKRTKFYKTYKNTIVEFEPLGEQILRKYIKKEIPLSDKNCNKLMEVCEYDYGRCLLEIDKIKRFIVVNRRDDRDLHAEPVEQYTDYCFRTLLESGAIYQPPKDAIFDFVDAILDHKVNSAFNLYHQCLAVGEATMVMLSVLYMNAKATLQVQSCNSSDIAKSTGLTPFQISNAKKHARIHTNRELINIMRLCQSCQQAIVTGELEEEFAMEKILVNVLTNA